MVAAAAVQPDKFGPGSSFPERMVPEGVARGFARTDSGPKADTLGPCLDWISPNVDSADVVAGLAPGSVALAGFPPRKGVPELASLRTCHNHWQDPSALVADRIAHILGAP